MCERGEDTEDQQESNRGRLHAELAAEREALLAVVSGVDEEALEWPTRNPEWAVRDVLAHVLASDADLIWLVEAAGRSSTHPLLLRSLEEHRQEMARWEDATPQALADELRERAGRWGALLAALPGSALAMPVAVWWSTGTLGGVLGDWRGHDSQHGEDVRLALADGPAGAPEATPNGR